MTEKKDLKDIHPDLEPITSAPSLFTFYGCGVKLYGNRDFSPESNSSVKTQFLTLFYVPLIPLKSYRVIEDGQQYYYLGRVPVSKTARKGSIAALTVGALAIGGIGTQTYLSSEGHKFGKTLASAEQAVDEGRYAEAMGLYKTVYDTSDSYRFEARNEIQSIMKPDVLKKTSDAELAGVLEAYNSFGVPPIAKMPEGVYTLAADRVKSEEGDKDARHKLLHAAQGFNPEGEDFSALDSALVKSIYAADPTNIQAATETAQPFFEVGDYAQVKQILGPVKDNLGDSEGARILGQTYVAEGLYTEAYPLLTGYISTRLQAFQNAEARFNDVQNELWEKEFDRLNNGLGPDSFYTKYDETPVDEQQLMVDTYLSDIVIAKPKYESALNVYRNASQIVPVVMDYGILQLKRAEGLSSPDEREAELKAAEETFLSIKNIAGDSDDYKIYLGQVYFWLGKQDLGQSLFDEVLEANGRASESLISISLTLRSLGKVGLAQELAQEAYDNAADDPAKYNAAHILSLLSNSLEEKVKWLERSDPKASYIQASLKENQGQLAVQKGDTDSAIRHFKEAIKLSESMQEGAVSFNNTALIYFSLHDVTGDKETFKTGVGLMTKAVELQSDDSILMGNASAMMVVNSLYETLPDKIQFEKLKSRPNFSSLSWYYSDQGEKDALRETLRGNAGFKKAVEYSERSVLLAPNNADGYDTLSDIYYFMDDSDALTRMVSQMKDNQIDISANQKLYQEYVDGESSAEDLATLKEREVYLTSLLSERGLNTATRGALESNLTGNIMAQIGLGDNSRIQDSIKHAQKAFESLPSDRTSNVLNSAHMAQASFEVGQDFPAYKAFLDQWGKGHSDLSLVALMMRKNPALAEAFKANSAFQKVVTFEREDMERFPNTASPTSWALLDSVGDPLADKILENYKASPLRKATHELNAILTPYAGNTIVEGILVNEMLGRSGLPKDRKDSLDALGVAIPNFKIE